MKKMAEQDKKYLNNEIETLKNERNLLKEEIK